MKNIPAKAAILALLVLFGFPAPRACAQANAASESSAEDLGHDVVHGKTNKIIRISNVTPLMIYAVYEGGTSGRWIPRTELPPQLESKYRYDAKKAAETAKQQVKVQEARRAEYLVALRQREVQLSAQLNAAREQMARIQEDIRDLNRQIRNTKKDGPLRGRKNSLIDQQNRLGDQVNALKDQLSLVRSQINNAP
jgi:hypothetical protein